jgi:mannitol 2-dehydrogenase
VACWFRCLAGTDERGNTLAIVDRRADELQSLARSGGKDSGPLLELKDIFGDRLTGSREFRDGVGRALASLYEKGARATLAGLLGR